MLETPISLKRIITSGDKEVVTQIKRNISYFKCSRDLDVEKFLRDKSLDYDMCDRARTYICRNNSGEISAYFSITSGILELNDGISVSLRKRLTYGRTNMKYAPAYLIAQIGKDDKCLIKNVSNFLFDESIRIILSANQLIAGRIVYLECKDNDKLRKLYETVGFRYLQMNGRLMQMVTII